MEMSLSDSELLSLELLISASLECAASKELKNTNTHRLVLKGSH